ncbi:DUF2845 domain-containing protein [Thiorhodovibrio frisius]|uniref:DUF2845 domain-containing protein n=1 Tax=Thiorhodovibrio frisius TaxID=631362 RepID=H8YVL2_9GAMM|nr:DUF2845 domain-containing protein [Thiorhodovibrio frisius]EIC23952.1 Protein of unknown function (DUF2845) [Thiorhodovibrio frisius]WPL23025.1 hypothetical protein Thiofri_03206 [Thiorhodovibrio frisius]
MNRHRRFMGAGTRLLLLVALWLGFTSGAWALRCGNHLVAEKDPSQKLVRYCGQPASVERLEDRRAVQAFDRQVGGYVTTFESIPYEIWTYNFGPQRFMMRITVREGLITRIESAGYGY